MNNRKMGNSFEAEFCEILAAHGFWAHNMAQNSAGQPADVIAAKNGSSTLIDCKVCSVKGFPLSRIEDNQHLAMQTWQERVATCCWFALKLHDESIRMISYNCMSYYIENGMKYLDEHLIREDGCSLEGWMDMFEVFD